MPKLDQRATEPELMDLPDSDPLLHSNTLAQFSFINRHLTRARHLLKRHFVRRMLRDLRREYHLVDLGAGACETAAWLIDHCRRKGIMLRVTAIDHDRRAVSFALENYSTIDGLNVVQGGLDHIYKVGQFDFVYANHLLHHLRTDQIGELFEILQDFPRAGVLVSDIHRTRSAYFAYFIVSGLFLRNSFARYDGLLSIRKGFRKRELIELISNACPDHAHSYEIQHLFPARITIQRRLNARMF